VPASDEDLARTAISGCRVHRGPEKPSRRARRWSSSTAATRAASASPRARRPRSSRPACPIATTSAGRGPRPGDPVLLAGQRVLLPAAGRREQPLTRHLLAGLKGGISSEDGLIRVFDLFEYVQPRSRMDQPDQHPVFKADLEDNFPVGLYPGGKEGHLGAGRGRIPLRRVPQLCRPRPGLDLGMGGRSFRG